MPHRPAARLVHQHQPGRIDPEKSDSQRQAQPQGAEQALVAPQRRARHGQQQPGQAETREQGVERPEVARRVDAREDAGEGGNQGQAHRAAMVSMTER
jgi:hypothetical protein